MKRTLKILGWSIGSLLTIFVLGLFCTYWWLSTKWTDFYTEEEMKKMAHQVSASPTLPDNFYKAYDKVYPGQRDRTLGEMSFAVLWSVLTDNHKILSGKQCNCIISTYYFDNKVPISYHSWTSFVTAHGLENYTTEEKCLDFYYGQIDLQTYSSNYFHKSFNQLTFDENLELILRLKAPTLYDKRPDLLTKQLIELKK